MDGVDLGAVKVAVVLPVLQVTALLDVLFHLFPCDEAVVLAVPLLFPGLARRDWRGKREKARQFGNRAVVAGDRAAYSHGTVVPYRSGFMKISLFFKLLRPTP